MPQIKINVRVTENRIGEIQRKISVSISNIYRGVAEDIIEHMQDSFLEPKSGRIYFTLRGPHQASAPNEPPAYEYGDLYNSFRIRKINQYAVGIFSVEQDRALILEEGGGNILPRPFIAPAVRAEAGPYINKVHTAIRNSSA